jgi:hypothetical protein
MTRLGRPTEPVRPSAPDPVDAWLDVLVTMLAIPKADRRTVRDELEDHLRSRIDDLLIHGLTEPQALQKAVAELGETADLARQLSRAHKPPRTRRYAMHALLIALTGTVVALGVNQVKPAASAIVPLATPAVQAESPKAPGTDSLDRTTIEIDPGARITVAQLLQRFADRLGLAMELDASDLQRMGLDSETEVVFPGDRPGPLALSQALNSIMSGSGLAHQNVTWAPELRLTATIADGRLLVMSRRSLDLRTTDRKVYDVADLVLNEPVVPVLGVSSNHTQAVELVRQAVMQHVRPNDWLDNGGDIAAISALGTNLVITAPRSMHEQIGGLLSELYSNRRSQIDSVRESIQQRARIIEDEEIGSLERDYAQMRSNWELLTKSIAEQRVWLDTLAPDVSREELTQRRARMEIEEFERTETVKSMDSVRSRIQTARARLAQLQEAAAALP